MPDPSRTRSAWEVLAWIVGVVMMLGLIGVIALRVMIALAFPPLPDLHRPASALDSSVLLDSGDDPHTIRVHLSVPSQAVVAAAAGDGLVHLELDVSGVAQRHVEVKVGVTWRDPAAVVRPLGTLEPGADVKWTLPCAVEAGCDGLLELTFEPGEEQSGVIDLQWRLVAEVRPARGADLSEHATVLLTLRESTP